MTFHSVRRNTKREIFVDAQINNVKACKKKSTKQKKCGKHFVVWLMDFWEIKGIKI